MAKNMARIENGIVVNVEWCSDRTADTDTLISVYDRPVTAGDQYIDGKFYKFSSPEVEVINTVGSGDSSVSGIAVGLSRGMSIIDSVKLGMAAGTANTQSPETGVVTKELVEKYYKEIIVDTI